MTARGDPAPHVDRWDRVPVVRDQGPCLKKEFSQRGRHGICARPRRRSSPLLQNLVFSTHKGQQRIAHELIVCGEMWLSVG